MPWSRQHDKCIRCGTQTEEHTARGLCIYCYRTEIEKQHNAPRQDRTKRRLILKTHTINKLEFDYVQQKMSLSDLALKYGCTRQYIYKLLKQFGIKTRDRATAREVALSKGKITWHKEDEGGNKSSVTLQKITINTDFFKSWSPAMAYVLGVIYTDGNLLPGVLRDPSRNATLGMSRFTVSQKEPEILHKILKLMACDAKLYASKQPLYFFHITNEEMYDDLLRFGLKPNKSLSIEFPTIPQPYVRHFIRGCWDGDGSFYFERRGGGLKASFVSGSKQFIEGIISALDDAGIKPQRRFRPRYRYATGIK